MQLRFHARADACVQLAAPRHNAAVEYVGRKHVALEDGAGSWPAVEEPFAISDRSEFAQKLMTAARRGELWPADKETAEACGCAFVPVIFNAGEWLPGKPGRAPKE